MSEASGGVSETVVSEAEQDQNSEQTKATETVDFWKQKAREQEKRAKENAGAAKRLAEIEAANQTEAEKAQARVAELEAELTGVRSESNRLRIAGENGITDADDIALFLTGTDEETLTKQAKRLAERTADRKKQGNHAAREGGNSTAVENPDLAFLRQITGQGQ